MHPVRGNADEVTRYPVEGRRRTRSAARGVACDGLCVNGIVSFSKPSGKLRDKAYENMSYGDDGPRQRGSRSYLRARGNPSSAGDSPTGRTGWNDPGAGPNESCSGSNSIQHPTDKDTCHDCGGYDARGPVT